MRKKNLLFCFFSLVEKQMLNEQELGCSPSDDSLMICKHLKFPFILSFPLEFSAFLLDPLE
jgi:hypothetical protein